MCLRASLRSKGDSVNRDFDNQASYLSIAQANLVSGTRAAEALRQEPLISLPCIHVCQKTIFHNSRSFHFAYKVTFFKTNTEISI